MTRPPAILFVHRDHPGQFGRLARWLARRGWEVAFATAREDAEPQDGIRLLAYAPHRAPSPATHPYAQPMDRAALEAQGFARAALAAKAEGLDPDIVVAHSGWGAGMFASQVFPRARYVAYCEWWYRHPGADTAFLREMSGAAPPAMNEAAASEAAILEQARNAPIAMDLAAADAAICPTLFQRSQFPPVFRDRLAVMHDGIDTGFFSPDPAARGGTLGGLVPEGARLVTYATRGMEPHRGFPQFMEALARILDADPQAFAVIAGENRVAYGGDAQRGIDWKARALSSRGLDPARIRFTGKLAYDDYLTLLRRSDAHVYLTVPFVLSWSMLEAMSTGCALVASATAPVTEHADETCARLADLRDPGALAARILETLSDPDGSAPRRASARARILRDLDETEQFRRKEAMFLRLIGDKPARAMAR